MREKTIAILLSLLILLATYSVGFANGQESVYEKAKNDAKFYEQVWGK